LEHRNIKIGWKVLKFVFPVLLGAVGGFLYHDFIGCNNGCAITGNPYISTAYGAMVGAVLINWKSVVSSINNNKNDVERGEM
jgi:hypothetical protein